MNQPTYQCYACGWYGENLNIQISEQTWIVHKGHWVEESTTLACTCPECSYLFVLTKKEHIKKEN